MGYTVRALDPLPGEPGYIPPAEERTFSVDDKKTLDKLKGMVDELMERVATLEGKGEKCTTCNSYVC